jgi:hypothetical protein
MPDREKPIVPDFRRVIIHEEHELNYWTKEFGVSEKELRQAVMEVGTSAEEVKKYLEEKSKIKKFGHSRASFLSERYIEGPLGTVQFSMRFSKLKS